MADLEREEMAEPESGVWWDGVLNPMSPAGLRAALAEEDEDSAFRPSDIRWVAWPGYGQRVHVSQVDELMPYWAHIQYRRIRHWLITAPLGMLYLAYHAYRAGAGWERDLHLVLLGLLAYQTIRMLWSRIQLLQDPKAWGRRAVERDQRRKERGGG